MRLALFVLAVAAFAQKAPKPIPLFAGDDNPQHNGQPQWCSGVDEDGFAKNCGICARRCGMEHNAPECKTYCRAKACKCHPECGTTGLLRRRHEAELKLHANLAFAMREWATTLFMAQWEPVR
jgi:hypothetical protein